MAIDMRWGGGEQPPIPYLLRAVRIGVGTTVVVLLCLVVFPLLPGHQPFESVPYSVLVSIGAAGGLVVALVRWRRLFETGLGQWALYVWSAFDIGLIAGAVAATGSGGSELWILYGLTTVFFAASYPPRGQLVLFGATMASYLSVLGITGMHEVTAARLFFRLAILCV